MTKRKENDLTMSVAVLLGWKYVEVSAINRGEVWGYRGEPWEKRRTPDYATDWAAMREVVEWIRSRPGVHSVHLWTYVDGTIGSEIESDDRFHSMLAYEEGTSLPEALCRAALTLAERHGGHAKVAKA